MPTSVASLSSVDNKLLPSNTDATARADTETGRHPFHITKFFGPVDDCGTVRQQFHLFILVIICKDDHIAEHMFVKEFASVGVI